MLRKILLTGITISLAVPTYCLSMNPTPQQTLQQRIDALGSENERLRNSAELQNKYLWSQHGVKIALYTGLIATTLIINSQLSPVHESCKESKINDCINLAAKKSTVTTTASLAGGFLLIELVYFLMTLCITKIT